MIRNALPPELRTDVAVLERTWGDTERERLLGGIDLAEGGLLEYEKKPWAHFVLGGVDTGKFSPDESTARRNTVLFVGRLLPHKGIDDG